MTMISHDITASALDLFLCKCPIIICRLNTKYQTKLGSMPLRENQFLSVLKFCSHVTVHYKVKGQTLRTTFIERAAVISVEALHRRNGNRGVFSYKLLLNKRKKLIPH